MNLETATIKKARVIGGDELNSGDFTRMLGPE